MNVTFEEMMSKLKRQLDRGLISVGDFEQEGARVLMETARKTREEARIARCKFVATRCDAWSTDFEYFESEGERKRARDEWLKDKVQDDANATVMGAYVITAYSKYDTSERYVWIEELKN